MEEVKQVLRALEQVLGHLGQLPDLCRELSALSEQLAPVLQGQSDEIAKLDRMISEKQETDAFKLSEKLAALTTAVAAKQEKHDQLEASERSVQERINALRERLNS